MRKQRKVIFQDIDGVLYPCRNRRALRGNGEKIKQLLCKEDRSLFEDADAYDLQAAYEGWDKKAVERLAFLLRRTKAELVISSSWKFTRSLRQLQQLFGAVGLNKQVCDMTKDTYGFLKTDAIGGYLKEHPEITAYVVLDDLDMSACFPRHCVVCPDLFDEECLREAEKILGTEEEG